MRRRALPLAVVFATGACLVAGSVSRVAATARPAPSPSAVASVRTATLPTGDAVQLRSVAGRRVVQVVPAARSGVAASYEHVRLAGRDYVFPTEVRPFLGSLLDPSLFDVGRLASVERHGRLPVRLTAATGARVDVPGLSVTSRSGAVRRGYLSRSGAAALRTALVREWRRTVGSGRPRPASLFGSVTSMSLPRTRPGSGAGPGRVSPDFPQVTLIIKVVDEQGRPVDGDLLLANVDDARKYVGFVFVRRGEARVSVPFGNYSGLTDVASFDRTSGAFADRLLIVGHYSVRSDHQTLTFDARRATAYPTVRTQRSSAQVAKTFELDREAARAGGFSASFSYEGRARISVTPVRPVRVGALQWLRGYHRRGPASRGTPVGYDLSFADQGSVPADEHEYLASFQLATVSARYYSDRPRRSQFLRLAIYPFQQDASGEFSPLHTPTARTDYVYGGASARWFQSLLPSPTFRNPFAGEVDDDLRSYAPGSAHHSSWLRGMLRPGVPEQTSADTEYFCPACRSAHRLQLSLAPFTDTEAGHGGGLYFPGRGSRFRLYRNGERIAAGRGAGTLVKTVARAATYRLHVTVPHPEGSSRTSTRLATDLVFSSSATHTSPLPTTWYCAAGADRRCRVVPLLSARLALPTTLSDRLPVGTSTAPLRIAPFRGAGTARITATRVLTKVAGARFARTPVVRTGNGRYRVRLRNPASSAGKAVTLRVVARDASGDRITQTTRAAYLVARH